MSEPVSRSIGSGFASPAYPVISSNPAFKVEILPLSNRFEQENKSRPNTKEVGEIKVGEMIRGEIMGGSEEKTKEVRGRVLAIDKNDDDVLSFKVLTKDGDEVSIDPTTASKVDGSPEDYSDEEPANENQILSYKEWLYESKRRGF